jgi:hypothetical protein
MSYISPFNKIVTTSKVNHRYYGPTESKKARESFSEVATDLSTIFNEIEGIKDSIDVLASGYLLPSGSLYSLYDLKMAVYDMESKIENRIYAQADPVQILE